MKVGLEQRAGTRQTSPVNDCWPVTLVPAVSEIPSGAGGAISPNVTGPLWNPAHSPAVLLAAASSRGNEHYLSAFKSVCFKDDLPHLTITEFPKFSPRYCCCSASLAVHSSASAAARQGHHPSVCSRLLSAYAEGPARLLPPAVPWLGVSVETWKPSDWKAEENKAAAQSCTNTSAPLS